MTPPTKPQRPTHVVMTEADYKAVMEYQQPDPDPLIPPDFQAEAEAELAAERLRALRSQRRSAIPRGCLWWSAWLVVGAGIWLAGILIVASVLGANAPAAASMQPAATVGSAPEGASSVQVRRLATDAVSEPAPLTLAAVTASESIAMPGESFASPLAAVTWQGVVNYAAPSLGRWYLAIPAGPGIRVRICGPAGCLERISTDAGPDLAMQRAGRIADLNWIDWQRISGVGLRFGGFPGTVLVLSRVKLPATDTLEGPG